MTLAKNRRVQETTNNGHRYFDIVIQCEIEKLISIFFYSAFHYPLGLFIFSREEKQQRKSTGRAKKIEEQSKKKEQSKR